MVIKRTEGSLIQENSRILHVSTFCEAKRGWGYMGKIKEFGEKLKLIAAAKRRNAPRWADIKKFSLKRARSRRIRVTVKHWRRGRHKI